MYYSVVSNNVILRYLLLQFFCAYPFLFLVVPFNNFREDWPILGTTVVQQLCVLCNSLNRQTTITRFSNTKTYYYIIREKRNELNFVLKIMQYSYSLSGKIQEFILDQINSHSMQTWCLIGIKNIPKTLNIKNQKIDLMTVIELLVDKTYLFKINMKLKLTRILGGSVLCSHHSSNTCLILVNNQSLCDG